MKVYLRIKDSQVFYNKAFDRKSLFFNMDSMTIKMLNTELNKEIIVVENSVCSSIHSL